MTYTHIYGEYMHTIAAHGSGNYVRLWEVSKANYLGKYLELCPR